MVSRLPLSIALSSGLVVGACGSGSPSAARLDGVLATGQTDPYAIAVDDTSVYWVNYGTPHIIAGGGGGPLPAKPITVPPTDGEVRKCEKSGCDNDPSRLASGVSVAEVQRSPSNLAIGGGSVYWSGFLLTDAGIGSEQVIGCSTAGCNDAPLVLWSGSAGARGLAATPSEVYWTGGATGVEVAACSATGCGNSPTLLATNQSLMTGIATDGVNLYWRNLGQVLVCAVGGCGGNPEILVTGQLPEGGPIAVDTRNVYWTIPANGPQPGQVMACAKSGCSGGPTTLVAAGSPGALAVDGTSVYFVDGTSVSKCAVAGCNGQATVVAANRNGPSAVAVDATRVYWTESGTAETGGQIAYASK